MAVRHGLADMYGFIPVDRHSWGGYAAGCGWPDLSPKWPPCSTRWGGISWATTRNQNRAAVLGPGIRGWAAAAKRAGAGFVMVTGLDPVTVGAGGNARSRPSINAALTEQTGGLADVVVDVTVPAAFPHRR